jgi:XTP/dITP diphosphohydrolase
LCEPFLAIKKVDLSVIRSLLFVVISSYSRYISFFLLFQERKQMNKNNVQILIATKNSGKILELKKLLADLPIELLSLKDFPDIVEVDETGATFAENAALKARGYALQTGVSALADDSGLEVDALGGAPGIHSARYAGENASDAARIEKLLEELSKTRNENRTARFVCAMSIADRNGEVVYTAEELCEGTIAFNRRGQNGFGYDSVFIPSGFEETFGELAESIKQKISHRGRASIKIIRYLLDFIAV